MPSVPISQETLFHDRDQEVNVVLKIVTVCSVNNIKRRKIQSFWMLKQTVHAITTVFWEVRLSALCTKQKISPARIEIDTHMSSGVDEYLWDPAERWATWTWVGRQTYRMLNLRTFSDLLPSLWQKEVFWILIRRSGSNYRVIVWGSKLRGIQSGLINASTQNAAVRQQMCHKFNVHGSVHYINP